MKSYMYDMAINDSKNENSVAFEKIMVKGFAESADLECDYGDICAHWLKWNPNGWFEGYSDWLSECALKYSTFVTDAYIVEFMGAFDLDCKFEATGRGWFKITI